MPLVAYDPKKYNIEEFSVQCIRVFQSDGYYLTRVGLLTHAPGVMFALEHVEKMDDAELHRLKAHFYTKKAKSVTSELNAMNNKIYFQVYLQDAPKAHIFSKLYKLVPPLPVILIGILCLYELNKTLL